jgi:hypothetical protein
MVDPALFGETWKHNVVQNTAHNITVHILATIPLGFFSEFFEKVPLIRNSYFQLVINTNTNVLSTLTYTVAASAITNCSTAQTTSPFGVCPFMVSPAALIGEADIVTGLQYEGLVDGEQILVRLDIARSQNATATPHPLSQCRLYATMVTLTAQYEAAYLQQTLRKVLFNDVLVYSSGVLTNIPARIGQVNNIVTSGLSRLRKMVIFPFINAADNANVNPTNSPFTSEPGTCSPFSV